MLYVFILCFFFQFHYIDVCWFCVGFLVFLILSYVCVVPLIIEHAMLCYLFLFICWGGGIDC